MKWTKLINCYAMNALHTTKKSRNIFSNYYGHKAQHFIMTHVTQFPNERIVTEHIILPRFISKLQVLNIY